MRSRTLSLRNPAKTPSAIDVGTMSTSAKPARRSECQKASMTSGRTGIFSWVDSPQSPVTKPPGPGEVADDDRPVGAQLLVEQLDLFFSGVGSQDGPPHTSRHEDLCEREDEDRHQDECRDHQQKAGAR